MQLQGPMAQIDSICSLNNNDKTNMSRSSYCGVTGWAASLEHWGTGSIPGQAQQVKDLAWPWHRSQPRPGSDPWPGTSLCHRVAEKGKKQKNKKKNTYPSSSSENSVFSFITHFHLDS